MDSAIHKFSEDAEADIPDMLPSANKVRGYKGGDRMPAKEFRGYKAECEYKAPGETCRKEDWQKSIVFHRNGQPVPECSLFAVPSRLIGGQASFVATSPSSVAMPSPLRGYTNCVVVTRRNEGGCTNFVVLKRSCFCGVEPSFIGKGDCRRGIVRFLEC